MKIPFQMALFKAVFVVGVLVVCALWAFEHFIIGAVLLSLLFVFDFAFRRRPFCGKHFSIQWSKLERCPFCGKSLK